MLFKKNKEAQLSDELFKSPTAEYRGTPFWSWNCKLEEKELLRQIGELKEMGFGGFHIHSRAGMATEYLGDEFMRLVKSCVRKAKKEDMLAWLYDEDRWPSGFAGGYVTKEKKYRSRHIVLTPTPPKKEWIHLDYGKYDVTLNDDGTLHAYRRLSDGEAAEGRLYYAFVAVNGNTRWYNNQAYVDVMNRDAIDRFIEVTHEAYKNAVGKEFDKTIPAIFTDEPAVKLTRLPEKATDPKGGVLPWTDDFDETCRARHGISILERLPELFWNLESGKPSEARYRYHAHVAERFSEAYTDRLGAWCRENGLSLSGHLFGESSLELQARTLGEAMPLYRGFGIPGIDILYANYELNTAKQCQSSVRQYGKEGMLSELYGVTSWDFDFRGYKLSGDWQAALGVTVRVPHLAWVSMEGEAKRDYPAAIGYQSAWYKQYRYVEDHFSRLHTALSRGRSVVRIGVIHPIESYWLHYGSREQNASALETLESNFDSVVKWLLYGGYDFDYICESTLPELCEKGSAPLRVGEMAYDAVVVPACETLRSSTVERLEAFRRAGGRLIFMGGAPRWMDATESDLPRALYERSEQISFSSAELIDALEPVREVALCKQNGTYTDDLLYQMREDGGDRWLFVCKGRTPSETDPTPSEAVHIELPAYYKVKLYDTLTGEIRDAETVGYEKGRTVISVDVYDHDSFLFRLSPIDAPATRVEAVTQEEREAHVLAVEPLVPFTLNEPNALLLSKAEYALDGGEYFEETELLRADSACRRMLGWYDRAKGATQMEQPWCIEEKPIEHHIRLRFRIESELRIYGAMLAIERPENAEIVWNGKSLDKRVKGYYVDRSIKTIRIPVIQKGENILELTLPFGERTNTEWCYILGDFGTRVVGETATIVPLADALGFSSIVPQGLPFYSGALDYHLDVDVPEEMDGGELVVRVPYYKGSVVTVLLDGERETILAYAPYEVSLGSVSAGKHRVTVRLFVPRTNGFGPVHLAFENHRRIACPESYRYMGDLYGKEYHLRPEGVMMKPQVMVSL